MVITEISLMHHVCIVLVLIWLLNSYSCCYPVVYFGSLMYLYLVHERHIMRVQRKLRFEETRNANQRRVLTDSETVRWLNYAVEKIWLVCMEQIVSQKILLPIIPWFLQKYKPWTAKEAVVQHLYMGRNPPMLTEMRVSRQPSDDDHLVLELGMNFLTGDDMSAILAVKLRKRLGFGMWAKLHVTGMHIEGKVLVGVKFLPKWPFLGRLRVCFVEPPYFQMTVKPIFTHGLDVAEFPGIAGWLDKLLSVAFEQTLVEPNMLVVDVEKFTSPEAENWFFVDEKVPVAFAKVELVEGSDMKPSDLNGLADPYVKGQLGAYRFRTKTQKKTLTPKWLEEFKIPICSWDSPNVLTLDVRDKDHIYDDRLGDCTVDISNLRDGQRHDMWIPLQNIKTGSLRVAITVVEAGGKIEDPEREVEMSNDDFRPSLVNSNKGSFSSVSSEKSPRVAENFEPINVEGQTETGIWVHHPGSDIAQKLQPRKGKGRRLDTQIKGEVNSSSVNSSNLAASGIRLDENCIPDEPPEANKSRHRVRSGLNKFGSIFHRSSKKDDRPESLGDGIPSPYANLRDLNQKNIGVKLIVESELPEPIVKITKAEGTDSPGTIGLLSPSTEGKKDSPRGGMVKQATKKIKSVLLRKGSDKFGNSGSIEGERESPSSSSEDSLPSPLHYPTSSIPISNSSSCSSDNGGPINIEEQNPVESNINIDNLAQKESIDNLGGDTGPERVISRNNTMTKEEVETPVSIIHNES